MPQNLPVNTQLTMDATDSFGQKAIQNVFMIYCPTVNEKGSGFALKDGRVVTNYHVIKNSGGLIRVIDAAGTLHAVASVEADPKRDLAVITLKTPVSGGFDLAAEDEISQLGAQVITWGYPLGYNGPSPILSVGHLAGLRMHLEGGVQVKHHIVNGAFNGGNSGGALIDPATNKVVGVVVAKHGRMTDFQEQALAALKNNRSGFVYTCRMPDGSATNFSEAQLVADIASHFVQMTQVMIGEAIHVSELSKLLDKLASKATPT